MVGGIFIMKTGKGNGAHRGFCGLFLFVPEKPAVWVSKGKADGPEIPENEQNPE